MVRRDGTCMEDVLGLAHGPNAWSLNGHVVVMRLSRGGHAVVTCWAESRPYNSSHRSRRRTL